MSDNAVKEVRATIEALIDAGVTANVDGLDRIYHRDMKILMVDPAGALNGHDKTSFMAMLKSSIAGTNPDDHRWAQFHSVEADGNLGHVAITRKVPIGGQNMILNLSIDLIFDDNCWQVIREVIFARPNSGT